VAKNHRGRPQNSASESYNGIKAAFKEIGERMATPANQMSFWIYLVFAVMGLGGLAIWIEIWRYCHVVNVSGHEKSLDGIKLALATVFPAIIGSSGLELVLNDRKMSRNIGILFLGLSLFLTFYLLGFGNPSDSVAIALGIVGCIGAVCVWWIASGFDEIFQDTADPEAPVGGDVRRPLASGQNNIQT